VSYEVDDLEKTRREMAKKYSYHYDLYRVAYNNGKGGMSEPVVGASNNGYNNYFPKYSPDGKWIVYCQSQLGVTFLQPDAELYIVPAEGGLSRRLNCNFDNTMNSWHSWSPNGKWLIFASKVDRGYTKLFMTHIDEAGNDSPPILIENLSSEDRVINLPEFVNIKYKNVKKVKIPRILNNSDPIQRRESCLKCHAQNDPVLDKKVVTPEIYQKMKEWY
jgi:tricorn protease-like protein